MTKHVVCPTVEVSGRHGTLIALVYHLLQFERRELMMRCNGGGRCYVAHQSPAYGAVPYYTA